MISCLPDGKDTYVINLIPETFSHPWSLAMKCSARTFDVVQIQFRIDDPAVFEANGYGMDYDSSKLQIYFRGYYNMDTDSLFCAITTLDPESNVVIRIDSFQLLINEYQGEYINAANTYMAPNTAGCEAAFRFIFNSNDTVDIVSIQPYEMKESLWTK